MYWMRLGVALGLAILTPAVTAGALEDAGNGNWPQWRGPSANGVAPGGNPPVAWSEEKNVRFKLEIPGRGSSTPIVWEDRIYLKDSQFQVAPACPRRDYSPKDDLFSLVGGVEVSSRR